MTQAIRLQTIKRCKEESLRPAFALPGIEMYVSRKISLDRNIFKSIVDVYDESHTFIIQDLLQFKTLIFLVEVNMFREQDYLLQMKNINSSLEANKGKSANLRIFRA
jgi:hypothetical protein